MHEMIQLVLQKLLQESDFFLQILCSGLTYVILEKALDLFLSSSLIEYLKENN